MCRRCGSKFTDDRWEVIRPSSWRSEEDDLCGSCLHERYEQVQAETDARRQAEESADREAADAERQKSRGLFGRRR
ncbi:hypothetical protein [Streptomyces sp. NPDC051364]|uniref:hypothetical protein n=1 Tax=Streptomyces sp. NPDC051364 TaxID=3155799 RepID=UPI00343C2DB4